MSRTLSATNTVLLSSIAAFSCWPSFAHAEDINPKDLINLSLEQLSNIEVTSVSKKAEKASEAAAAIFVITQDDIRRSGATTIPEVLRIAPGINVARAGAHQWAVTARGFNDQFANKLLVLMDGRTVYTPLFSGVWWDAQDTPLEDIERIEVIRGPGATLWGANAVNGVINIITKNAEDTQGTLLTAAAGNQERALGTARYGGKIGENAHYRAYVKYNDRDSEFTLSGRDAGDDWDKKQGGFRADWKTDDKASLTVQGDIYKADNNYILNLPSFLSPPSIARTQEESVSGGNVLARWQQELSKESNVTLQAYFDNSKRDNYVYDDVINTFDLDFQHIWTGLERNEIIWGTGYRLVAENLNPSPYYTLTPDKRSDNLFSAFIQDKIALVPDEFFLTLGSKFEHNDYTGFEFQPSARLTWLVDPNQTLWASVSRAVKTPYRGTDDGSLKLGAFNNPPFAGFIGSSGNRDLDSERLIAYEAGYRIKPLKTLSFDISTFYNDYSNLISGSLGQPTLQSSPAFGTFLYQPILPINDNEAHSYGFEVAANWDVTRYWQLSSSYSFIDLSFNQRDNLGFSFAGKNPEQQFNLRSALLLPHDIEINNALYYTDSLPGIDIPDYWRFDSRVAWKPVDNVELSLVGQNLFDNKHPEFSGFLYQSTEQVGRSIYAQATLRF